MKKIILAGVLAVLSCSVYAATKVSATSGWPSSYGSAHNDAVSKLYNNYPSVQNVSVSCFSYPMNSSFYGKYSCTASGYVN